MSQKNVYRKKLPGLVNTCGSNIMKDRSTVSTQPMQLFAPSADRVASYSVMWIQIRTKQVVMFLEVMV